MSAPPLPDIFGNYVLGDFVEVISPDTISWWPQTAGWLWLEAALLLLLLRYGWRRLQHWYRNRYRREAAVRLRQLALAGFSREHVARLSGSAWVDFLNRHCPSQPFSPDLGKLLARGVYETAAPSDATRQALLAACLEWVNQHESPAHV